MNQPQDSMGRTYVVVIPSAHGAFSDIRACYAHVASESPWLRVISPAEFATEIGRLFDRDVMFVHWAPSALEPASIPLERRALLLPVYSEAFDPSRESMLDDHIRDWERFQALGPRIDGVFAHTPWMAERVSEWVGRPGFVLPVGWGEPMGKPVWKCEKQHEALFAGSLVGRRAVLLAALRRGLDLELCQAVYGPALIDRMNLAKVTLYVAHSSVRSYSTWRIWQALCSSSALATEPGDWWPLRAELCIPLPRITLENVNEVAEIVQSVSVADALARARALRHELAKFTTRFCVERYMIDKTKGLSR